MPAPRSPEGKRRALIVLGMHRSGTSTLAGMLNHLGADTPATLMKPSETNPKGYFESDLLAKLNEDVLLAEGSNWHDVKAFPKQWYASPERDAFRERLSSAIDSEFGASPFFVLKDPRLCKILPVWLDVLRRKDIEPLIVLIYRDPFAVANSLEKRNNFSTGHGLSLWLRYTLDAEYASREVTRTIVSYESVLKDWRTVARHLSTAWNLEWPVADPYSTPAIDEFIDPGLNHGEAGGDARLDDAPVPAWIKSTYRVLRNWRDPAPAGDDIDLLDRNRAEFDRNSSFVDLVMKSEKQAAQRQRVKAVQGLQANLNATKARLAEAEAALKDRAARIETLEAGWSETKAQLAEAERRAREQAAQAGLAQAALAVAESLQARMSDSDRRILRLEREYERQSGATSAASADASPQAAAEDQDRETAAAPEPEAKARTASETPPHG